MNTKRQPSTKNQCRKGRSMRINEVRRVVDKQWQEIVNRRVQERKLIAPIL